MVKELKKIFKNLINKSKADSNLEIDAAVVNSNTSDNVENQQNLQVVQRQQNVENGSDSQHENVIDRFDSSQNSVVPSSNTNTVIDLHPTSSSNMWNTAVNEVNSVQNVYNFSNIDGLHIGNSFVINSRGNRSQSTNSGTNVRNRNQNESNNLEKNDQIKIKITAPIKSLFHSREDVEESVLSELSEFIGKNYQRLMRNLGLSQAQIETVELDYSVLGHKEIIFQLLLKWSEEFFENANYGELSKNLWRCNCRESVAKLEEILSRNKTKKDDNNKEEKENIEKHCQENIEKQNKEREEKCEETENL